MPLPPLLGSRQEKSRRKAALLAVLGSAVLHPLPFGAVGDVSKLDALGLQLITDAVGLGKILGLLGVGPGADQRLHGGIGLAGLAAPKACPQCGAPVSDDALFCNKCGAQL